MLRCPQDNSFGPVLTPSTECANFFDFTLLFEDLILSIVPCCIFSAVAFLRIILLLHKERYVDDIVLHRAKLITYVLSNCLQLTLTILWAAGPAHCSRLTLTASSLDLVSLIAIAFLSNRAHYYSAKPSSIIQIFLVAKIILDAARLRTQWLLPNNDVIASIFSTIFTLRVIILILESLHKNQDGLMHGGNAGPERGGVFSRSLFLWLNPLFLLGYSKSLSMEDLQPLENSLTSTVLYKKVEKTWNLCDKSYKHSLAWAVIRAFFKELTFLSIPRVALIGFTIVQPFLVERTLDYISKQATQPREYGYGLLGAYVLVYGGLAISNGLYGFFTYRLVTMLRDMRPDSTNASIGVSLMSNDIDIITIRVVWFVSFIPCCIEVGLALWILWTQLEVVFVAPIITVLASAIVASYTGKLTPPRQRAWMQAIQNRVGITTNVLSSIRGVKMTGLSGKMVEEIQGLRDFELDECKRYRVKQVFGILLITQMPPIMIPAITFAVYAISQHINGSDEFGVTKAFTSLSVLGILVGPVAQLIHMPTNFGSAMSCLDRIQQFLLQEKNEDFRELEQLDFEIFKDEHMFIDNTNPERKASYPLIKLSNASFGWCKDKSDIHDINLEIRSSSLVMVVGPVGCGKTTLLASLLGETYKQAGSAKLTFTEDVSYCGQDLWILNKTIKDNIIGPNTFDKVLYGKVIDSCQLREDLEKMPGGDSTLVGSQGGVLSGGQKQRLAIARAVYGNQKFTILDDSFKGLDAKTAENCFNSLLGWGGLLRDWQKTVVLATYDANLLPFADQIIVLSKDGYISDIGTFEGLRRTRCYINDLHITRAPIKDDASITSKTASLPDKGSLIFYLGSMGAWSLSLFVSLLLIQIGCRSMQPLWLNFQNIGKWVGVYIEVGFYLIVVVPKSAKVLHRRLLDVALTTTDIGEIVFSQDLTLVDLPLPVALMVALERTTEVIAQLILTCVASGYLALIIPIIGINLAYLDSSQRPAYLLYCMQRWLTLVLDLLIAGLATLLVGLALALRSRINPGLLGVALSSVVGFGQTLTALLMAWTQLETSLGAITRIRDFERLTPQEYDGDTSPPNEKWPSQGAIRFLGISVTYGPRTVLSNINLQVQGGQKVAICGRSGSGKSTLLSLLLCLSDASSGKITINGLDVSHVALEKLRGSLVTLPQESLLLLGIVSSNLDPCGKLTELEQWAALEKVGLEPLFRDKGGLCADLNVDWLSAGQKQLFCIARALLIQGKILLLDEATSSLDQNSEKKVMELIRNEFKDWTVIAVAHRLHTIIDFDKVAILEDGSIEEFDNPKALLERGGVFKTLWDLQEFEQ
ncbi:P-loop containing nucleoside triphosphate hydrolase protein [Annulohypoxylon bovei var. microspora]|nr:P-loop containing nucleoside triphosphate hydrolase protein [Annulohypoxylon bovei var. microspora]